MYLYNFDIVNKKIIAYDRNNFNAMIVELQQPLLSFINCDFSEYDTLRRKIFQFIQSSESKFEDLDSDEIEFEIKKNFPDFNLCGIDNGELWWIAELCVYLYLKSPCDLIFDSCTFTKNSIQDKGDCDYLYWKSKVQDKVEKVFDIDNDSFISDFSPICRLNYYFDESYSFNEITLIYPSRYQKFTNEYRDAFLMPFYEKSDSLFCDKDYIEQAPQRQEYIKKKLHVINGYHFDSLEDAFNCEILKLAQIGIKLKKCRNCGNYFLFNPKKPADYCTNKPFNRKMTCQQIAAQHKYTKNISPIQKIYNNALKNRNKWYPPEKSGLRTPEQSQEYKNWKNKTSKIRDEFRRKYENSSDDIEKQKILENFKETLRIYY